MKKIVTKRSFIALGILVIVATGVAVWFAHRHHQTKATTRPSIAINASATNPSTPLRATPNPNVGGGPGNGSGSTSNSPVYPPFGSFASSYTPKLNDQEQSTCNTTPGATCTISFTKDGVTKSLPSQAVATSPKEEQAFTSWDWTPAGIGLTAGSWQVSAIASLNGHQSTTTSNTALVVQP